VAAIRPLSRSRAPRTRHEVTVYKIDATEASSLRSGAARHCVVRAHERSFARAPAASVVLAPPWGRGG
jgi:hypothetical protein